MCMITISLQCVMIITWFESSSFSLTQSPMHRTIFFNTISSSISTVGIYYNDHMFEDNVN